MIKKILRVMGIIGLTCFSFYYTDKVVDFSKSKDEIMIAINNKKENDIIPVNAEINDNYIIPGISGKVIDKDKSYEKMKSLGEYNDNLLIFKDILPDISINNNYDKYLSVSNGNRDEVSLVFLARDINFINKTINITKEKNVKPTFFVNGLFLDRNIDFFKKIKGDIFLENYGYNNEYNNTKIKYTNNLIYNIYGYDSKFCLLFEENNDVLNECCNLKMHTIIPDVVSSTRAYFYIRNNFKKGSAYFLDDNDYTINELSNIIAFINQRGVSIVSLDSLFKE